MNARRIPPPKKFGPAASRMLVGALARQPKLVRKVTAARLRGLLNMNPEVYFRCYGRHLEKSI